MGENCMTGEKPLTDEKSSVSLKDHVGVTSEMYSEKISAERIQAFGQAIGLGRESTATPPTFLTLFRHGEFDLLKKIGVDLARVLHAEQEYDYENEIQAGRPSLLSDQAGNRLRKTNCGSAPGFHDV